METVGVALGAGLAVLVGAVALWAGHRSKRAATASRARFDALLRHSPGIAALVDDRGRLLCASDTLAALLGHDPHEVVGLPAALLVHPDDRVRLVPGAPAEVRARTRTGRWHPLEVTITDLRDDPDVRCYLVGARDLAERKALESELHHRATHDPLTGLDNRLSFLDHVAARLGQVLGGEHLATLAIDLDDFKAVNDSLGHGRGDELLVRVAERLNGLLQGGDLAARLGGDDFAMVIHRSRHEDVVAAAERAHAVLAAPYDLAGTEVRLTASIGVAFSAADVSADLLLRNADVAVYLAKERGKDRVEVFREDLRASVFERLMLKADLAEGIESGQLRLCYQPIVSLRTGRVTGVEALVRWDHPRLGQLGPAAFVPLAEDTGLIVPLGRWVLEEACRQLRAWRTALDEDGSLSMSVNLSVRQLLDDDIIDLTSSTMERFDLEPGALTLELTESMLMLDADRARTQLDGLRRLGVSLAVDDFGTGYSSLGYVQDFDVDVIKIDRSFVEGLHPRSGSKTIIVQTMIEMAERLGAEIVAEGIEDRAQLRLLQDLGCNLGQGYLFSAPVEADAVGPLLAAGRRDASRFLFEPRDA